MKQHETKKLLIIRNSYLVNQTAAYFNDKKSTFEVIKCSKFQTANKNGANRAFILIDGELHEFVEHTVDYRGSCFIDETVQSQSPVFFSAKFNMNYFLIEYFAERKSFADYLEFESIAHLQSTIVEAFFVDVDAQKLKPFIDIAKLEKILDVEKASDDDDEKTIRIRFDKNLCNKWMSDKAQKIQTLLESKLTKKQRSNQDNITKCKTQAFELIALYVNSKLASDLHHQLFKNSDDDIKQIKLSGSPSSGESNNKKAKC